MPHDCKQDDFSSGPVKSQEILKRPALWLSTNLEMIQKYRFTAENKKERNVPISFLYCTPEERKIRGCFFTPTRRTDISRELPVYFDIRPAME
jgi:hypothetical protein